MRVELPEHCIELTDGGEGTAVVLLHGFPLSAAIWAPIRPALEGACRLITPDLRGFGGSEKPEGDYSMEALAADVASVLELLGVERYVLGGHSMGGYVALRLAAAHPERLLGIVLVDSKAAADNEEGKRRRAGAVDAIRAFGPAAYVRGFMPVVLGETTRLERPGLVEELGRVGNLAPAHVLVGCQQGMAARPDSSELLASLDVPVLVVVGEEDALLDVETASSIALSARRGHLAVIPEAGHTPSLEQPAATATALLSFLRANALI
jgi:pimeloyl-ACP methyl ester carboxylesterase